MLELLSIVSIILNLGNLVCLIIVLTKLFPKEGALMGIFGLICGIYTFIWGWQNVDQQNLRQVMLIWTVCFLATIILRVLFITVLATS